MSLLIAIDVGHIGKPQSIKDKGAEYEKMSEADLTLLYAVLARGMLEINGINTVLLCYDSYIKRQSFCMAIGADVHLQCHLNAAKGKYGLILYRESNSEQSVPLASIMSNYFEENLPITECKIEAMKKDDSRCGCVMGTIPSLILEPLFLDNEEHYEFLKSEDGIYLLANSITQAILDWRK